MAGTGVQRGARPGVSGPGALRHWALKAAGGKRSEVKEELGQRREIWAQGGDTESSQGYINPEELGKAEWAGREQPRKYPV